MPLFISHIHIFKGIFKLEDGQNMGQTYDADLLRLRSELLQSRH